MGKVGKIIFFSDYFHIDRSKLAEMGVFNPMLNLDTHLFIDPLLLKSSKHPIIREQAFDEYNEFFSNIIKLLPKSKCPGDFVWKVVESKFPKKEIGGTCLGYGANSTSGRGISAKVLTSLLNTAKQIVDIGITDPELFSLLPLFNKGIGPDTISDITTSAIHKSLLNFTAEQAKKLQIPLVKCEIEGELFEVIKNPCKKRSYIILLPTDILRDLPLVRDWDDIANAASFNHNLRIRVNKLVASIFRIRSKQRQKNYINSILADKSAIQDLIQTIKGCETSSYDINSDNERLACLDKVVELTRNSINSNRPKFVYTQSHLELERIVSSIIEHFTFMVEHKGLNKLLWKEDKKSRCREGVPQLIFHMVALTFCQAYGIDVNPEVNTGSGLIDFKFSKGSKYKSIVEIKYSDNPQLLHGIETQLPQYMISEKAGNGHYLILDVGNMRAKPERLEKVCNDLGLHCEIHYVDAHFKKSASKL